MPPTLLSAHEDASPDVQMPNVFVVPPEEDDAPTWCCFNASESPCLDDPLSTLEFEPDAPWSHNYSIDPFASQQGSAIPGKSRETRSILDVLMNDDYMESDEDMEELEPEPEPDAPETDYDATNIGNDSMVVEVVKVRRYIEDIQDQPAPSPPTKPSKSFKQRASMALRSLVGKGLAHSKSKPQPISSPTNEDPPPKGKAPAPRSSGMLSQIFLPSSNVHAHKSVSSFDTTQSLARHPSRSKKSYPSSLHNGHPHKFASLRSSSAPAPEPGDFQSPPGPSTKPPASRRRFSAMALNRIFSSSSPTNEASNSTPNTMPRTSSGPSMDSSSGPETPTDDLIHIPRVQAGSSNDHDHLAQEDVSFEMKLDSFHFDDLSFDVDRF
ncbi:hypothetical protein H0H92_010006 [Tricholoma furcatifolium]|nr:hypothetical protein H0H92_010006 [Tricholoma furcatifolium]